MILILIGLSWGQNVEAADEYPDLSGSIRVGPEYDTNPYRLFEQDTRREDLPAASGDGLARYFGTFEAVFSPEETTITSLNLQHGGKQFVRARGASIFLTRLRGNLKHNLSELWMLETSLDIKDRTEQTSRLDYNTANGTIGVMRRLENWRFNLDSGWQYFLHKPNSNLSSHGPIGTFSTHYLLSKNIRLGGYYQFLQRNFENINILGAHDGSPLLEPREDTLQNISLTGQYQKNALYEFQYRYALNNSTNPNAEFDEHRFNLSSTFPLFWGLLGTVELDIRFGDVGTLNPSQTTDEDNHHRATLSIAKPIDEFEIEGRFSRYTSSLQIDSEYQRSTFYLNIATFFGE